ncbi:Putative von Willebrand factor, vWF type A domain protein STM2315 [hydrothermal vent metagenome]|uniref:von Willebrand factor, vWF type A domain protein STM2315 n=1 Tax=hydrothermal vent metagenome TaxID=652676 RepID=A0A3B0RTI2_9ZZZZ
MRHFSIYSKSLCAFAAIGLLGTATATPLGARSMAHPDDISRPIGPAVNCGIFRGYRDRYFRQSMPVNRGAAKSTETGSNIVVTDKNQSSALPPPSPTGSAPAEIARGYIGHPQIAPPYPYPYPRLQPRDRERYDGKEVASIMRVAEQPVSTFAVDVDTGSYSNVRRFLNEGRMPPQTAVRTEEMINYFRYDYPKPASREVPFSVTTDISTTPWNDASRLLRIGLRGYDVNNSERPRANLVFLVDVSGSMGSRDKLPLVKSTLLGLTNQLRKDDRVSIVVYAGAVGVLLQPTSNKEYIRQAVECMNSGGGTAGGHALKIAYQTAQANYDSNAINRIIMTTDGDFNVGTSSTNELKEMVAKERESGVTLTMLGYGRGNIRDELMEGIANVGNGNYAYIDSAMEAKKVLGDELSSTLFTIAKDVKIQIEFNPAHVKEYRLIGYENRLLAEEDFNNDKVDAGDIGAGHQVTALYEIMPASASGWLPVRRYPANRVVDWQPDFNGEMANVKLRYKLPNGSKSRLITRQIAARDLQKARTPTGDMAFTVAVAAFGQKLRGDKYLGEYNFRNINMLSGTGGDYWRQEFRKLSDLASSQTPG